MTFEITQYGLIYSGEYSRSNAADVMAEAVSAWIAEHPEDAGVSLRAFPQLGISVGGTCAFCKSEAIAQQWAESLD